jgi:Hydrazine synthase alpha subunit middle domain
MSGWRMFCAAFVCGYAASGLGEAPAPTRPLVVAQTPRGAGAGAARDRLDRRYGAGSRVVVATAPWGSPNVRVLSEGLHAVGGPVLAYDGERVYFPGKAGADGEWQIYETRIGGGHPRLVTSMPGGATAPALLPDGSVVFASPVPKLGSPGATAPRPQLYAQLPGGQPRQLTFGLSGAADPTVLLDGRILFVSATSPSPAGSLRGLSLFTINNDGTEITAFACQHDPPAVIGRPRQLLDGRVAFLASGLESAAAEGSEECVRMARPFVSRAKLLPGLGARVRSACSEGESALLVCAENSQASWAVYRVDGKQEKLGAPLFEDARWDCVEAVLARASQRPMGRLSTMDAAKKTGLILCMNVNDTTYSAEKQVAVTRIRVLAEVSPGRCRSLGEVPVQEDGSFMAEIPADIPLGFEALNREGEVVRRVEPVVWVRPGENRACTGCHAAHNRAPHNHRPLAVYAAVPCLPAEPEPSQAQTMR